MSEVGWLIHEITPAKSTIDGGGGGCAESTGFTFRRCAPLQQRTVLPTFSPFFPLFFFMLLSGYVKLPHRPVNSISILHARITDAPISIHSTGEHGFKISLLARYIRGVAFLIAGECGGQYPEIMSAGDLLYSDTTVFYREKLR